MTTQAYLFLFVGLCVLGAAYQTQTGWLYLLGAGAIGMVPLAYALAWWDMRGARGRVLPVAPASQGGPVVVELVVERAAPGSALGVQALLPDLPPGMFFRWWRGHLVPEDWHNRALGPFDRNHRARAVFELVTTRRGEYGLPGFYLQSAFPLGLVALARPVVSDGRYLVYPVGPRLDHVPWLAPSGHESGQRARPDAGLGVSPRGVREYQPGDPWRQIHWRTTARRGIPHVKETEHEEGEALVLFLDMRAAIHTEETVEHLVTLATSVFTYARHQGRNVSLSTQFSALPTDDGRQDEASQLSWLARVSPTADDAEPPVGPDGAVLLSPAYVAGWQRWASNFIYAPGAAANALDASVYCPVGASIPLALAQERRT